MEATVYQMQLGDAAPNFENLPGVDGKPYSLSSFQDEKALVVFWHCNHCPYAQAFEDRLNQVTKDYASRSVGFIAINSNDPNEYPEDSFENMTQHAKAKGLVFPYVFDETQLVAEAYSAVCTPHLFLFDPNRRLVYQGRVDGDQHNPAKGNAQDLRNALEDVLADRTVRNPITRAFGCSIKWGPAHFKRAAPNAPMRKV